MNSKEQKIMSTITEGAESNTWKSTQRLRFINRDVTPKNKYSLISKTEKVLEQLWISDTG